MKDRPQLSQGRWPEATGPGRGHGLPRTRDPDMPTVVHRGSLEPRVATACLEPAEEGAGPRTCCCPGPGLGHQTLPTPPPCVSGPGSAHSTRLGPSLCPDSPRGNQTGHTVTHPTWGHLAPQRLQVGPWPGVPQSAPGVGDRGHGTGQGRSWMPSRSLELQAPGTKPWLMKRSPPGTRRGALGHRHHLWGKAAERPSSFLRSWTLGRTCQPAVGEGQEGDCPVCLRGKRIRASPSCAHPSHRLSPFSKTRMEEQADLSWPLKNGHKTQTSSVLCPGG